MVEQIHTFIIDTIDETLETLVDFLRAVSIDDAAARWKPKGPTKKSRHVRGVPLATYLGWLEELESGPLGGRETSQQLVQRLRRLYYSAWVAPHSQNPTNAALWMFDLITRDVTGYGQPPLTTDELSRAALDGLFSTATINAHGEVLNVGHLWASADIAINGDSAPALATKGIMLDTNPQAMTGWLGDLGNVLDRYAYRLEKLDRARATDAPVIDARATLLTQMAGKDELLADMDGLVIGQHWARHPAFTISTFVDTYYHGPILTEVNPELLGRPSAAHRFHYFLNEIEPSLPMQGRDSNPLVVSVDRTELRNRMPEILAGAYTDVSVLRRLKLRVTHPIDVVIGESPLALPIEVRLTRLTRVPNARQQFHYLCDEFSRFLQQGVDHRVADWPA